jgi:hypothetical protein
VVRTRGVRVNRPIRISMIRPTSRMRVLDTNKIDFDRRALQQILFGINQRCNARYMGCSDGLRTVRRVVSADRAPTPATMFSLHIHGHSRPSFVMANTPPTHNTRPVPGRFSQRPQRPRAVEDRKTGGRGQVRIGMVNSSPPATRRVINERNPRCWQRFDTIVKHSTEGRAWQ